MFADKLRALLFVASLAVAAASAYMISQEDSAPAAKLKPLAVVSPSFIKEAKDPRANAYLPVVNSLSAGYGAFFLGGWAPSDVVDNSLISASRGGFYGLDCSTGNPYSRGTISAGTACCVNTLNRSLNESMPNGLFSTEPEVYKISRTAYTVLSQNDYQRIRDRVSTDMQASVASLGGSITGLSVRVSDSAISANLVNSTLDIINNYISQTRTYGSCSVSCGCTDYVTNPECVNVTVSACGTYHINLPCFLAGASSPPGAPTGLAAQQTDKENVKLTWTDPVDHDIQLFYIYMDGARIDKVSYGNVTRIGGISNFYENQLVSGYYIPDGNHCFRVSAVNSAQLEGAASGQSCIYVDKAGPAVASLAAARVDPNNNKVSLTWPTPAAADLNGYVLYRNGAQIATPAKAATGYVDRVPANGTYTYRISAYDALSNYGPNASSTILVDNITTMLAQAVRAQPESLKLGHSFTISITANLNQTIRRVTLYKRVASMYFDVDVDVNYTIGGTPYSESFRKRLTITPSEIPISSGQPVAARVLSAASCRYSYEVDEQVNIEVAKDRSNPADVVNDWFGVDVRYTEADIAAACASPGVNTGIAYGGCLVN